MCRETDCQLENSAAEAVRVEHELTVPVLGHFDPVARSAVHSPQARRRRAGEGVEWQLRLIDKVLRRLVGPYRRRAKAQDHQQAPA
ncbi:MAG: hypothetical protein ACREXX_14205 [Gammaproteobacteria bacterium]